MPNQCAASKKDEKRLKDTESGKRIQFLRVCGGITQETLAAALNISTRHMAYIEAGSRNLVLEHAERLADYFGTTLDYVYSEKAVEPDFDPLCKLVLDTIIIRMLIYDIVGLSTAEESVMMILVT